MIKTISNDTLSDLLILPANAVRLYLWFMREMDENREFTFLEETGLARDFNDVAVDLGLPFGEVVNHSVLLARMGLITTCEDCETYVVSDGLCAEHAAALREAAKAE